MNQLKLIALTALLTGWVAAPTWAQTEPSPQFDQTPELSDPQAEQPQTGSIEPLQVTEQDRDQFFKPAPTPRLIQTETGGAPNSDRLIQPPPGSQTPGQMAPQRRLSLPLP